MKTRTLILGAGAAGLMAAAQAGPGTLVIDHARAPGEKIRISGGGRCNFTNMHCDFDRFLGANPHFHKSALSRYTQWDFLDLVQRHDIPWHEKTLGQLFCDRSARDIVAMLLAEIEAAGATLWLHTRLTGLRKTESGFVVSLEREGRPVEVQAGNLVVATGGKSIPRMGATGLAYDIARQFGLKVTETRPGLVPLTFADNPFAPLAGVATPCRIGHGGAQFVKAMLFTHRGLSGPAILQISSYWREVETPSATTSCPKPISRMPISRSSFSCPEAAAPPDRAGPPPAKRLVDQLGRKIGISGKLGDQSDKRIDAVAEGIRRWHVTAGGSEGYRTAEVTLGGSTRASCPRPR